VFYTASEADLYPYLKGVFLSVIDTTEAYVYISQGLGDSASSTIFLIADYLRFLSRERLLGDRGFSGI
jgi:hypothetical protein